MKCSECHKELGSNPASCHECAMRASEKDYDRQVYRLFAGLPDLFCSVCQHPIPSHQTEAEHAAICDVGESK